ANRAIDPTKTALAVEQLYVLGADHHIWYQRIHHLVIDGYGVTLLNKRIAGLYNILIGKSETEADTADSGAAFGEISVAFAEDEIYRQSDKRQKDAAYWRDYLANLPEVTGLAAGKAVSAHQFERAAIALPSSLTAALRARADVLQVPWPDLVTALT